jgi:hypothetical protein
VAELSLDDVERDALARHLHGMGVVQLMGREASADPGLDCELPERGAHRGG